MAPGQQRMALCFVRVSLPLTNRPFGRKVPRIDLFYSFMSDEE